MLELISELLGRPIALDRRPRWSATRRGPAATARSRGATSASRRAGSCATGLAAQLRWVQAELDEEPAAIRRMILEPGGPAYRATKRAIDIVGGRPPLLLLAPAMG